MNKKLALVVAIEAALLGALALYAGGSAIYESMRHWVPIEGEVRRVWAGEVTDRGDFHAGLVVIAVGMVVIVPAVALIYQGMHRSVRSGHANAT